jgi:hypothetical protein
MLLRFCLSQPLDPSGPSRDQDLTGQLVQNCAHLCVTNAQKMIALIFELYKADGSIGLLPAWWYRVYYIHLAATVVITAKLKSDHFIESDVLQAWEQALSVLRAHEYLGLIAQQSVNTLQALSTKVGETQVKDMGGQSSYAEWPSSIFAAGDVFRDMTFGPANPSFGLQDMFWLNDLSLA